MRTSVILFFLFFLFPIQGRTSDTQALQQKAQELESLQDKLTEEAEKACYWGKKQTTSACMEEYVRKYNKQYGAGSFEYVPELNFIRYTGIHLRQAGADSGTADYHALTRQLIGDPEAVIGRIENFLAKHPQGKWHRKGELLLGRIYQDLWWILKKGEGILIEGDRETRRRKAEGYRSLGLSVLKELSATEGEEGRLARKEYRLLQSQKDDGKFYGIVQESLVP